MIDQPGIAVARHRTAMVRHGLSQPVSLLLQHGVMRSDFSLFDYGCGQGDDLRVLKAAGLDAEGWDPHFAADNILKTADVVNIGFVLNVIEDEAERMEALRRAWALAKRTLAISTMIVGQASTDGLRQYRDGYLTSRGTFQKYFAHAELRELITAVTGVEPVAVSSGIFFAFRDSAEQEDYLLRRRMGRRLSVAGYRSPRERSSTAVRPELTERIAEALVEIAELARMRGRAPVAEELSTSVLDQLAGERVALPRAIDLAVALHLGPRDLDKAATEMREDLLIHFALARLNRRKGTERPSSAMMRDIRCHFGSQRELLQASTDYLMALADADAIAAAIAGAAADGYGAIDHRGRLLLDARRIDELPGILRVYLGCGAYLAGEAAEQSLVRIDSVRRVITYFTFDDLRPALPRTTTATTIDLRRQSMSVAASPRILVAKSEILGQQTKAQRDAEAAWRAEHRIQDDRLLVKVD